MNNTRKRKSGVTKHVHLCSVIVIVELTTKQLREVVTQSLRRHTRQRNFLKQLY